MNKRELIEHINNTLFRDLKDTLFTDPTLSITESAKDDKVTIKFETEQGGVIVGGMLKKFGKVTVPQFVADWIEEAKKEGYSIFGAINKAPKGEVEGWIELQNVEIFAEAWVNGYEVEKEKRYRISLKNGQPLLKAYLGKDLYFSQDIAIESYKVTRKELEEDGFGWVFDCEGVEIEEVEG